MITRYMAIAAVVTVLVAWYGGVEANDIHDAYLPGSLSYTNEPGEQMSVRDNPGFPVWYDECWPLNQTREFPVREYIAGWNAFWVDRQGYPEMAIYIDNVWKIDQFCWQGDMVYSGSQPQDEGWSVTVNNGDQQGTGRDPSWDPEFVGYYYPNRLFGDSACGYRIWSYTGRNLFDLPPVATDGTTFSSLKARF